MSKLYGQYPKWEYKRILVTLQGAGYRPAFSIDAKSPVHVGSKLIQYTFWMRDRGQSRVLIVEEQSDGITVYAPIPILEDEGKGPKQKPLQIH